MTRRPCLKSAHHCLPHARPQRIREGAPLSTAPSAKALHSKSGARYRLEQVTRGRLHRSRKPVFPAGRESEPVGSAGGGGRSPLLSLVRAAAARAEHYPC